MNCPKCNSPVDNGSLFCSNCGTRFDNTVAVTPSNQDAVINNVLVSDDTTEILTDTPTSTDNVNNDLENVGENTNSMNNNSNNSSNSSLGSNIDNVNSGMVATNVNNSNNTNNNMSNMSSNSSISLMTNNGVGNDSTIMNTMPSNNGVVNNNTVPNNINSNNMNGNINNTVSSNSISMDATGLSNKNNAASIVKITKSSNLITLGFVVVIAIITVGVCYLMTTGDKKSASPSKDDPGVVATDISDVTVNGRTGKVPKGWSFISGIEYNLNDYESVLMKDSQDSLACIMSNTSIGFAEVKANMYTMKVKLENAGFSDIDVKKEKKNGVEYVLFDGLFSGNNYHILYLTDGTGIFGSEGVYASAEDLTTIINFVTTLKKNTVVKSNGSTERVQFFDNLLK